MTGVLERTRGNMQEPQIPRKLAGQALALCNSFAFAAIARFGCVGWISWTSAVLMVLAEVALVNLVLMLAAFLQCSEWCYGICSVSKVLFGCVLELNRSRLWIVANATLD